jgi:hypothetical protein
MRKFVLSVVIAAAFAVGISVGLGTPSAQAGKTKCWTECLGDEALECCRTGGIVLCRVVVGGC